MSLTDLERNVNEVAAQSLKNIGGHLVWEFCRVSFYSFFILIKEGGRGEIHHKVRAQK